MSTCPQVISGNAAYSLVSGGWSVFMPFAQSAFALAESQIGSLTSWEAPATTTTVTFAYSGQLEAFAAPPAPGYLTMPPADFGINDGGLSVSFVAPKTVNPPPFNLGSAPPFSPGSKPDPLDVDRPGSAPTVDPVEFPDPLTVTMPVLPELVDLTLPPVPTITLPTFDATAPEVDFLPPSENFGHTLQPFDSTMLTATQAKIEEMLGGGTGLPAAIETALRERAYADVDRQELTAVQQVTEDFASRGFTEPNGVLADRLLQIRQTSQGERNKLSRDIYIRADEVERENLRFAVTQGVALTQILIGLHIREQELLLDINKFALQVSIDIFNARVTLFNAEVSAYNTFAQVYREKIQAELAKVELYKAQIEAERAKGEINEQRVRLFEQLIRGVLAEVEVFTQRVAAAKARVEANTAVFEGYRTEVQAYAEHVRAHALEWDGFRASVDAEIGKARVYEIAVGAYGTRVNAINAQNNVEIEKSRARTAIELGKVEGYKAKLSAQVAKVQAAAAYAGAIVSVGDANARIYGAAGSIAAAASEAATRQFQAGVETARAEADINIKNAELNITAINQSAALLVETKKGAAQAATQLAASSMSAVNFSAGVSASQSDGNSTYCSTSYNYSGELAT